MTQVSIQATIEENNIKKNPQNTKHKTRNTKKPSTLKLDK
tara:strand:- start:842 stop:961 length:120 start_codon:yes stop_codon:yes gene_type:complete